MMGSHSYKGDHQHHHVHGPTYSPTTTRLSLLISRPSTPPEPPPPPPQTVSVPFKWEEAPGKPRRCHTESEPKNNSAARTLELPPRLLSLEANKVSNNMNLDVPSPTTVLAGPYVGRAMSFTSSYRTPRDSWVSNFGSARWSSFRKITREDDEGSFDFSDRSGHGSPKPKPNAKITRAPRRGSSLSLPHQSKASSHFWASIYESFKHMVPWRRKQEKQRKRAQFDTV